MRRKTLPVLCLATVIGGCASPGPAETSGRSIGQRCSTRVILNLRASMGPAVRLEQELQDVARSIGATVDVLQTMGRNSRLVMVRTNGPQQACERAVDVIAMDLRVESINRF